jgi:hypothetical protein
MTAQQPANTVTPPERDTIVSHADQLRADALRWILAIAEDHHLPVPSNIETRDFGNGWRLYLHLDDDQSDAVRRWADTLGLPMRPDLPILGAHRQWTSVSAEGKAPEIVFAGWETVVVDSYCGFTTVTATDVTTTVAA